MQIELSPDDIETIIREADAAAEQASRLVACARRRVRVLAHARHPFLLAGLDDRLPALIGG